MKIEVGMYVRTKNGKILKINKFDEQINNPLWMTVNSGIMSKGNILKYSFNIIDLIEVGDYVNGYLVTDVYRPDGNKVFRIEIERDTLKDHIIDKSNQIKSIVTHEQFESMSYKIGE